MSECNPIEALLALIDGSQYGLQFGDGSLRKGRALKREEMDLIQKGLEMLNRRAPEAGQQDLIQNLAMLLRRFISLSRPIEESSALQNLSKKALDFLARHSLSGNPLRDAEPQAQAEPKPDKVVAGYTPGTDSMSIGPAEGQEPVASTPGARWRENGEPDPHGKVYDCERAKLCHGQMTDDELANAVFMQPSIDYLTAAKERIRWLSRQLYAQPQRPAVPDEFIDNSLDKILRAAGSALKHYTLQKSLAELRSAMREVLTAAPAPERPEES